MSGFEDAEVPFVTIGNRRGLTHQQVTDEPWLMAFYQRFKHQFEVALEFDAVLLIEEPDHLSSKGNKE